MQQSNKKYTGLQIKISCSLLTRVIVLCLRKTLLSQCFSALRGMDRIGQPVTRNKKKRVTCNDLVSQPEEPVLFQKPFNGGHKIFLDLLLIIKIHGALIHHIAPPYIKFLTLDQQYCRRIINSPPKEVPQWKLSQKLIMLGSALGNWEPYSFMLP